MVEQALPGLFGGLDLQQAATDIVDLGDADPLQQRLLPPGFAGEPGAQCGAAVQALFHQSLAQGGKVEHAEGHADPFEDVLVAPPGFLQDAEGVLFLGDVAQHPDLPALEDLLGGSRPGRRAPDSWPADGG